MMHAIRKAFNNLVTYLRNPNDEINVDLSVGSKIKLTALMFMIELPIVLLFLILFGINDHYKLIDIGSNKLEDIAGEFTYMQIIVAFVLIGPFLEEVIFRLPLKYKRNYLLRALVWIVSFTGIMPQEKLEESVQRYWKRYFGYFFYMMAFVFGFIHLTNFEQARELILLVPLLTVTQCAGGLIMGYLRVKLGFMWGYFYHLSFNFIFFTLGFLSLQQSNSTLYSRLPYHFKDDTVSIDIVKSKPDPMSKKAHPDCIVTPGKIEYHEFKLDNLVSSLYSKNYKYINTGRLLFSSKDIIDIKLVLNTPQVNTDSIRYLAEFHLQKALGIKIEKQSIQKDAWLLYVIDSTKLQKDSDKNELIQINGNLKRVGKYLDMTFQNEYIFGSDTIHQSSVIMPITNKFEDLPVYLEKEYGLGLKKVPTKLEFISIDLAETDKEGAAI